jgi:hypothetical protein
VVAAQEIGQQRFGVAPGRLQVDRLEHGDHILEEELGVCAPAAVVIIIAAGVVGVREEGKHLQFAPNP